MAQRVSSGVIEQLRRARRSRLLELVHGWTRNSGVLLLAKKRSALTALQDQFRARPNERPSARSTRRWSSAPGLRT